MLNLIWKGYADTPIVFRHLGYGVTPYPQMNNSFDFFDTQNRFLLTNMEIDNYVYLKSINIVSAGQGEVEISVRKKNIEFHFILP